MSIVGAVLGGGGVGFFVFSLAMGGVNNSIPKLPDWIDDHGELTMWVYVAAGAYVGYHVF